MLMATSFMLTINPFIYEGVYGFSIKEVALTSLAPVISVCIAIPYCGVMNDRFVTRLRHKKNFAPEWRLGFFLPIAVLAPAGSIIIGVCAQSRNHWIFPLIGEAFSRSFPGSSCCMDHWLNVLCSYVRICYCQQHHTDVCGGHL